jgi:hypothetical protein
VRVRRRLQSQQIRVQRVQAGAAHAAHREHRDSRHGTSVHVVLGINKRLLILFPTLIRLRSVQHVFYHVVIKILQLFLRSAACLTSTPLETGVGTIKIKKGLFLFFGQHLIFIK